MDPAPGVTSAPATTRIDTSRYLPAIDGWCRDGHLLSVCRLDDAANGLDRLVHSYAAVIRHLEAVPPLILAGPGQPTGQHRKLIRELELGDRVDVRLDVPEPDLIELYRTASVFVRTAREDGPEPFVLAAMACGLPVVATDTARCREAVVDGETGWLVPQEPVAQLSARVADRVVELVTGAGAVFGQRGRRRCLDLFSSAPPQPMYLGVYETLLGERFPNLRTAPELAA